MANHIFNRVRFVGSDESIASIKSFMKSNESEFDFNKVIPMPDELKCDEEWELSYFIATYPDVDIEKIPVSEYRVVRSQTKLPNGKEKFTVDQVDENNKIVMRDLVDYEYDGYYLIISKEELSTLRLLKSNMLKYGCPSWLFWRVSNWWSKWPAFDIEMGKDYCDFYTANNPVLPIIVELSLRFPDVLFIYYNYNADCPCPENEEGLMNCNYIKNGMSLKVTIDNPDNPSKETIPSTGEKITDYKLPMYNDMLVKLAIALKKSNYDRKYGVAVPRNLSLKDKSVIGKEAEEPLYCLHPMDYSGITLNDNNRKNIYRMT